MINDRMVMVMGSMVWCCGCLVPNVEVHVGNSEFINASSNGLGGWAKRERQGDVKTKACLVSSQSLEVNSTRQR